MKFSIITISMNSESVIAKTIESVLAQNYDGEVEYLIIDGASKDRTIEIAESYGSRFQQKGYEYRILSEPDHGIYDAMNKGIRLSTGDMIGIINSGDWYEPEALSVVSAVWESINFDMFYGDINLVRPDGSVLVKRSRMDHFVTSRHWNHPTTFVRKDIYDELGLFCCEGIHDDFEFMLRVRKAKKRIAVENRVLANFATGGASNQKGIRRGIRRIKDRYNCYRKNGYSRIYIIECIGIEIGKAIIS